MRPDRNRYLYYTTLYLITLFSLLLQVTQTTVGQREEVKGETSLGRLETKTR